MNTIKKLVKNIKSYVIQEFHLDWSHIAIYYKVSENFIRNSQDKVNWLNISIYQKLSEDFIREFQDRVDWGRISIYQKLSEDFIKEFQNKVNWDHISKYKSLSEKFIIEFLDSLVISECNKHNLNIIKKIIGKAYENFNTDEYCSICLINKKGNMVKTKCNHIFCEECIVKWLNIKYTCPMCRNIVGKLDNESI